VAETERTAPDWSAIPAALADKRQWLLWRLESKAGQKKPAKVPYYVDGKRRTGTQGDEQDRARLVSLAEARGAYERGKRWSGVGYAFLPGDGLIGVDIDGAIDPDTGEVNPRAAAIVAACQSWTEISQSGAGLHVYLQGTTETHKVNASDGRIGLEIFCQSQFFVVTGRTWPGAPAFVRAAGEKLLRKLHKTVEDLKKPPSTTPAPVVPLRDGEDARRTDDLRDALAAYPAARCGYEEWVTVGMGLKADLGDAAGFVEWDRWSAADPDRYPGTAQLARKWASFKQPERSDLLFKLARDAGWKPRRRSTPKRQAAAGRGEAPPPGAPPPDGQPPPGGDDGERLFFPFCNDKGRPRGIRENVYWALTHDVRLAGLVGHNEFSELHELRRAAPWGSPPGEWRAIDDLRLAEYLAHTHGLVVGSPETVQQAVDMASRDHPFNPPRDWMRAAKWDGIERLNQWLIDFVGCHDTPYTRAVGRLFLLGLVARVMRPGCKMDYSLILQGPQGTGKSTVFRTLAEPWFSDTPIKIGDKDSLMTVQGLLLYEFSELDSLARSEETAIKAFITSVEDRFRPPYGTRMTTVPRRVVLCGTTNTEEFLRDATGGRRFWPVKVGQIDITGLRAMRDQLIAEAVARFDRGERWYPTPEEEAQWFRPAQEQWKLVDVWADILRAYCDADTIRNQDEDGDPVMVVDSAPNRDRGFFSTQELITKALRIDAGRIDSAKQMQRRIAACMAELGFSAYRQPDGKRKRGYLRGAPPAAPTGGGDAPPPREPAGSAPAALAVPALEEVEVAL
jgi:predicted P-loop ATPase